MNAMPVRILLMEDDPGDVELILEALRGSRVALSVERVGDGEEGMRYLRRQGEHAAAPRPDLILLDLNMPRMDGISLIKEVRSNPATKFLPMVLLTTESHEDKKASGREAGATGWIVKPFKPEQLLAVVKRVLR